MGLRHGNGNEILMDRPLTDILGENIQTY